MPKLPLYSSLAIFASVLLYYSIGTVTLSTQLYWSFVLIAIMGIPHGAIDNIIYFQQSSTRPIYFYALYLGSMGLYLALWLLFPVASLVFFLLLSGYHFGQSQFSDLKRGSRPLKFLLYLCWGLSILSGLMVYNLAEIHELFRANADTSDLLVVFQATPQTYLLLGSSVLTLALILYRYIQQEMSSQRFWLELYCFVLIHFCFYALPLLIGFTLYFTLFHSCRVLWDEFVFLRKKMNPFSPYRFFLLLLPFTAISVGGSILLLLFAQWGWLPISGILLSFILISILTLPHSDVMEGFYQA